jgi:hypothetical protein
VRTLHSVLFRRELIPLSPKVSPEVSAKILRTPPEVRKNLCKSGVSSGMPEVGLEPTLPEGNRILSPRRTPRLVPHGRPKYPVSRPFFDRPAGPKPLSTLLDPRGVGVKSVTIHDEAWAASRDA